VYSQKKAMLRPPYDKPEGFQTHAHRCIDYRCLDYRLRFPQLNFNWRDKPASQESKRKVLFSTPRERKSQVVTYRLIEQQYANRFDNCAHRLIFGNYSDCPAAGATRSCTLMSRNPRAALSTRE
jgi:hypothetical protein